MNFTHIFTAIILISTLSCSKENQPLKVDKPNIITILVDDMGYSDIGCFGGEIRTPNIDLLAQNGLRMTQFYNAARCCPSRASLLTGLYPHLAGMGHQNKDKGHPSYRGKITDNATTIAEVLGNGGYTTYQVGKWHVGSERNYWPDKKGFDHYFTLIEGAMNYFNQRPWGRNQDTLKIIYDGVEYHSSPGFYATKTFSDSAVSFIEKHDQSKPFYMYLAYNAPHWPLHAPQEDIKKYKGKYMHGWDEVRKKRYYKMKKNGLFDEDLLLSKRFPSVPEWASLPLEEQVDWDHKMALYAAVMDNLDRGIGQVIDALKKAKLFENTIIIFLSDNGGCSENPTPKKASWVTHPTEGIPGSELSFPSYGVPWANVSNAPFGYFKSYVHEGGIATPLIVHFPGKVPSGEINQTTTGHIMDILPTLLDLAEIPYPEEINGRAITPTTGISLLPAFKGNPQEGHHLLAWEHQFNKALREGDWKLVSAYKILGQTQINDTWELYNLKNDPTEQINLADLHPTKVNQLVEQYKIWANQHGVLNYTEMSLLKR